MMVLALTILVMVGLIPMPEDVLNTIRNHAGELDVPYQSLIELWCAEKAAGLAQPSRNAPSR